MKLIAEVKKEARRLTTPTALIGFGGGLFAALIVMTACGNLRLYSFLLLPRHAPPPFIFYLIFLVTVSLLCGGAGILAARDRCGRTWIGCVFHLLSALFFVLWYISFMRSAAFVFSLIMLLCAAVMLFFAAGEGFERGALIVSALDVVVAVHAAILLWLTVSVILLN